MGPLHRSETDYFSIKVRSYPTTPEKARPIVEAAISYVPLPQAARLLLAIWFEVVKTLWHLRWLSFKSWLRGE